MLSGKETRTMKRTHRILLAANAALLGGLALSTMGVSAPEAHAQSGERARGSYTMIAAAAQGQPGDALYIVDNANQDMLVMRWNASRNELEGVGYVRFDRETGGRR